MRDVPDNGLLQMQMKWGQGGRELATSWAG